MLDNITRDYERDSAQDQLLQGLTEGSRASLGNLQAAVEMLDDPDLDAATRERFLAVVRDEAQAMARRIQELAARSTQEVKTRWPLEDMLGADLVAAALRRIEAACAVRTGTQEVDAALWLKVDSFALLQALSYLAGRLVDEFEVRAVTLRLQAAAGRAQLDLIWSGQAMSTETVMSWESEPMRFGAEVSPLSVRDVMQRHGGEFWFERDRVRHQAFFRFLLPLADAAGDRTQLNAAVLRHDSRPEYYDFDLFRASESQHALDDRRLVELSYTVFDTETTGLDPPPATRSSRSAPRAWSTASCCARRASSSWSTRSATCPSPASPSTASSPRWCAASPRSIACCRPSTPSSATPCWWRTTPPSTCASCSWPKAAAASSSTTRCSTRCCCRPWCTRTRRATGWRRSPSASASPSSAATPLWATPSSPPRSSSS